MKNPLSILFTDLHIHLHNEEEILDLINQIITKCKEIKVNRAICLGDVFDSRKSQPLQCLKTFEKILHIFNQAKIELICIGGNHDKCNYESEDSYLDQFQHWPGFKLIRDYEEIDIQEGTRWHFIPYFKEETTYSKYLEQVSLLKNKVVDRNTLFTHIGLDGIINNSNEEVKNPITKQLFKQFDEVFIGHYHNQSNHDNIHYIGSIQPQNFGEDNNKGCTILYEDGSHEFFKLSFKEYEKVTIDIDSFDKKKEQEFLQKYSKSENHIRFEFVGDASKISSLDKGKFESVGIDVKTKNKDVEETINISEFNEVVEYNLLSLMKEFDEFCDTNEISEEDREVGQQYLSKQLKS